MPEPSLLAGWLQDFGLAGLFLWSLLAATLVPLSSEAALAAARGLDLAPVTMLFLAATAGNVGGALINWFLGAYCLRFKHRRWFPVSDVQLQKAGARFDRWGAAVLLFSWIPVVGDPLTFAAGALRYPLARFLIAVTLGKAARYAVVLWLTGAALPVFAAV
ncbi:YqaA family protein [Ferrovibrio sp.]|uniref:YqaA family protein n=1 Tax=Ferrovibrio sp. TaxID=1917215 RepID=UPI003510FA21